MCAAAVSHHYKKGRYLCGNLSWRIQGYMRLEPLLLWLWLINQQSIFNCTLFHLLDFKCQQSELFTKPIKLLTAPCSCDRCLPPVHRHDGCSCQCMCALCSSTLASLARERQGHAVRKVEGERGEVPGEVNYNAYQVEFKTLLSDKWVHHHKKVDKCYFLVFEKVRKSVRAFAPNYSLDWRGSFNHSCSSSEMNVVLLL